MYGIAYVKFLIDTSEIDYENIAILPLFESDSCVTVIRHELASTSGIAYIKFLIYTFEIDYPWRCPGREASWFLQ